MHSAQLEYFLAVARTKRFSRAAEELFISQSSLSKQIRALEDELGVELFNRGYAEITLTAAGETFHGFARDAFANWEEVVQKLSRYRTATHGTIRVGALPLVGIYDLHSELADFQLDHMDVQIDYYERNQDDLLRRLEMKLLDIAFLRTDYLLTEEYEWIPLVDNEIVIICSLDHPLANSERVDIHDLADERFVLIDPQSNIYKMFTRECRRAGFEPDVTYTHARHEPLVGAVSRNIGITALPRGLTTGRFEDLVSWVPFEEPLYSHVGLVIPKHRELSPCTEEMVEFFRRKSPSAQEDSEFAHASD